MFKIKPILIVLALLAAGAAATALAISWDFEGGGEGDPINGAVPFSTWEGTLDTDATPIKFTGTWQYLSITGNIEGDVTEYDPVTGCYYVEEGEWDTDGYELHGNWEGHFCPSSETEPKAWGTWWATGGANCEGTWSGTVVE